MVTNQVPNIGRERPRWFHRVRRHAYRAYFSHMPLGSLAERAWYLSKTDIYAEAFRKGFEAGVNAGVNSAAAVPSGRDEEQVLDYAGTLVGSTSTEFDPDDGWGAPALAEQQAASGVEARGGACAGSGREDADSQELKRAPGPAQARRPSNEGREL